jgi:hypothetical protein
MYVSIVNEYGRTIQINTRQINYVQIDGKTMFLNYFGGQSTATSSNLVQIQTLLTVLLAQPYFLDLRQNGSGFLLNLSAIRYTDFAPIAGSVFVYFNAVNIIVKLPASLEPALSTALAAYVDTGGGGAGNGTSLNDIISQPSHGFQIGDILGYDGTVWFLAQANTDATSEVYGIVSSITDQNTFTLTTSGYVAGLTGLTPGGTYFLSDSVPGSMSLTEPTTPGQISKPIFLAMSLTSGLFVEMRGELVQSGGSGGGNGAALLDPIQQTAHGFTVGDILRYDGTGWVWSQANLDANSEVYGMVSVVVDPDNFIITTSGYVTGLVGLTPGTTYFLSAVTPGRMTPTEPTGDGEISKPIFLSTSPTSGLFTDMRGELIASGGLGANGTALSDSIMQINHGFSIGDAVRFDGTEWVWSQADSDVDSEVYGLVSNVIDLDNFTITTSGYIVGLSGLIPGTTYFLSAQIPGGLTSTEPLADGQVSKPLFLATSSSSGLYIDMRGELISIGGSPDTYTNETPTPVTVGGIPAGSTFVGLTTQQMWDWLLYSIHP